MYMHMSMYVCMYSFCFLFFIYSHIDTYIYISYIYIYLKNKKQNEFFQTSQKRMFKEKFGKKRVGKAILFRADLTFDRATLSFFMALKK